MTTARALERQAPNVKLPTLGSNFGHSYRVRGFEEIPRRRPIEPGIAGLNHQEESIRRRARERRDVEDRVIRLRQLVERPHPEERRQRRAEHRRLESDRNELRPADERTAA